MPDPAQPGPQTGIVITGDHNPLQWLLYLVKLTVDIDGNAERGSWRKPRFHPVAPGQHLVRISFPYLGSARGTAETSVQVPAGGVVHLRYHAPQVVFGQGRLTVEG